MHTMEVNLIIMAARTWMSLQLDCNTSVVILRSQWRWDGYYRKLKMLKLPPKARNASTNYVKNTAEILVTDYME